MPRTAPRVIRDGPKRRTEVRVAALPPRLARYAPAMLLCPSCRTQRLADEKGIILWHGELRDGKVYDCGGYNAPGEPIPQEE